MKLSTQAIQSMLNTMAVALNCENAPFSRHRSWCFLAFLRNSSIRIGHAFGRLPRPLFCRALLSVSFSFPSEMHKNDKNNISDSSHWSELPAKTGRSITRAEPNAVHAAVASEASVKCQR